MHEIYKALMDAELTDLVFIASFIAYPALGKAMFAGWSIRETDPIFKRIITQRLRYGFILFGQALMVGAAGILLKRGSVDEIIAATHEWTSIGFYGYICAGGVYVIAASPVITILAMVYVYCKPAQMGRKLFGRRLFVTTRSIRNGYPVVVSPETAHNGRFLQRTYHPVAVR